MLAQAFNMTAEREQQVAAQVVQARQVERTRGGDGQRLGLVERGEAFGDAVVEAHARGHDDQGLGPFGRADGAIEREAAGVDGFDRTAEIDQQSAARHQQREADRLLGGDRQAAVDQRQCGLVMKLRAQGLARGEIGAGGAGIVGPVEMLGGERQVARREPFGGAGVQGAAALVQQRRIGAVANEGVAEQELAAVGANQEVLLQQATVVGLVVDQIAAASPACSAGPARRPPAGRPCRRRRSGPCACGPAPGSSRAGSTAPLRRH